MVKSPQNFFVQYRDNGRVHFGTEEGEGKEIKEQIHDMLSEEDVDFDSLPVNKKLGVVQINEENEVTDVDIDERFVD